jgi:hypothetical protein
LIGAFSDGALVPHHKRIKIWIITIKIPHTREGGKRTKTATRHNFRAQREAVTIIMEVGRKAGVGFKGAAGFLDIAPARTVVDKIRIRYLRIIMNWKRAGSALAGALKSMQNRPQSR